MPEYTDYIFCEDCLMGHFNSDYSGLSYYLEPMEAHDRERKIRKRLQQFSGMKFGLVADYEFSRSICDCCDLDLAGKRFLLRDFS